MSEISEKNNKDKSTKKWWILILVIIIIAVILSVFIWADGTSDENEDSWEASGLLATERVIIEEVNIESGGNCTIHVRNIGKTNVTINNILFTLPNGNNEIRNSGDFTPTPQYASQGELITIKDIPITYSTGIYTIMVTTLRGVLDIFQVVIE